MKKATTKRHLKILNLKTDAMDKLYCWVIKFLKRTKFLKKKDVNWYTITKNKLFWKFGKKNPKKDKIWKKMNLMWCVWWWRLFKNWTKKVFIWENLEIHKCWEKSFFLSDLFLYIVSLANLTTHKICCWTHRVLDWCAMAISSQVHSIRI